MGGGNGRKNERNEERSVEANKVNEDMHEG
jgi:hypothetical protein